MFSIAMLAWWTWFETGRRSWLLVSYAFLALAMLAKGPVAPFLAAVIIAIFALTQRSWRIIAGSLWPPAVLLFFVAGLPWYVLVQLKNPQFFRVFILEHNLARFSTNMFHHPEPFWYYIPVSLLGWLPWVIFVCAAIVWTIRQLRSHNVLPLNLFLLIWLFVVIVFFSASTSKLPGYILPAIPAGTFLLASYLREKFLCKPNPILAILHALAVSALIFGAFMLRYTLLQHHFAFDSAAAVPLIASLVIAILVAIALFAKGLSALRLVTLIPAVLALAIALRFGAPALNQAISARSVSDALAQVSPAKLPVAVFLVSRETEFGLEFYRNQPIPRYENAEVPSGEHLVITRQGYAKGVAKRAPGRKITFLGSFPDQKLDFFYVGPQ
jgi:4-amino-4-deoxy-L-arabinose transferase-like glycosyltransferase